MTKKLSHDLICSALKSKKAYEKLNQYFEHAEFHPSLFEQTGNENDDYGTMSFLRALISHVDHTLSTDETIKILDLAIKKGANLFEEIESDVNFHGSTTLELAFRYQDLQFIKHLLDNTDWCKKLHDLDFQPMKEIFIFAAQEGEQDLLEYLAPKLKVEQIYACSEFYGNALMSSVIVGNYDNVLYLHQNFNFDMDIVNEDGMNLLMYATQSNTNSILNYLMSHHDFDLEALNVDGEDILLCAARNQDSLDCYQFLMSNYSDVLDVNRHNYDNEGLIHLAQENDNWGVLIELLNNNSFDFTKTYYGDSGFNILMLISPTASVNIVDKLLQVQKFDIEKNTHIIKENDNKITNAFLEAAEGKNHALLQYYLKKGYFIDVDNLTQAKECASLILKTKQKHGSYAVLEEQEQQKKCLNLLDSYLNIVLEKKQLEKNSLRSELNYKTHQKIKKL